MSEPVWLLETAVRMAHESSISLFGGSPGIRDQGLLESALARPINLYNYGNTDRHDLAAAYTVGIVKNHPFVDGNKRAGFLAGAAFLELNGFRLTANEADATQLIVAVAASSISEEQLAGFCREQSHGAE